MTDDEAYRAAMGKPVVGTWTEHSDAREAEEAQRGRKCAGCGHQRKFNREQYKLRTTMWIEGAWWHIQCWRRMHPGRTLP